MRATTPQVTGGYPPVVLVSVGWAVLTVESDVEEAGAVVVDAGAVVVVVVVVVPVVGFCDVSSSHCSDPFCRLVQLEYEERLGYCPKSALTLR